MSQTDQDKASAAYGKVVARTWRDPAFKAKLMADPQATLKEAGVAVPEGVTVKVVENTDTHHHLVLPPKPTGELSDEALDKVAGGLGASQNYFPVGNRLYYRGPGGSWVMVTPTSSAN